MISSDIRFEGFDSRSWTHLLSLFAPGILDRIAAPPSTSDAPEASRVTGDDAPRGTLFVIQDEGGRILRAHSTVHGRVRGITRCEAKDLPSLCRETGTRRCIVVREGVLEEMAERVAMRLARGDDYLTQWLVLLKVVREFQDAGLIENWPRPFQNVPVPTPGTVRRALDVILPDNHAMVTMLFERGRPWTSLALRRRAGSIDLVVGPDLIDRWTGPLGGDFRRDHRVVTAAVERAVAPVHLGVYAEVHTMRDLLQNPDPGAWARAAAIRDVILHPAPPYVTVALGADALRAVAATSARLLGGVDLLGALGPVGEYVRSRASEVSSITATLGFNPLRALAESLRRPSPPE